MRLSRTLKSNELIKIPRAFKIIQKVTLIHPNMFTTQFCQLLVPKLLTIRIYQVKKTSCNNIGSAWVNFVLILGIKLTQ